MADAAASPAFDHTPMASAPRQDAARRAHNAACDLAARLYADQTAATGCTDISPIIQGLLSAVLSAMVLDPRKDDAAIRADIAATVDSVLPQLRFARAHGQPEGVA